MGGVLAAVGILFCYVHLVITRIWVALQVSLHGEGRVYSVHISQFMRSVSVTSLGGSF